MDAVATSRCHSTRIGAGKVNEIGYQSLRPGIITLPRPMTRSEFARSADIRARQVPREKLAAFVTRLPAAANVSNSGLKDKQSLNDARSPRRGIF
jgi:hypothetical protein